MASPDYHRARQLQGCNTGWHVHDCDQILIVTSGAGIVATEHEQREINVGDVAHIKVGERHWHGAKDDTTMGHITITLVGSQANNHRPCSDESGYAAVAHITAWGYGFRARRQIGTADFPAFKKVMHLLEDVGAEVENRPKNRVAVKLQGQVALFTHAHHDLSKDEVVQVRKFLESCGITPAKFPLSTD